jgi:IS5 family transposase
MTGVHKHEHSKASVPAKVEHPSQVIKRQFGLARVRFLGLQRNTADAIALSNLWMARHRLIKMMGVVRPKVA